MIRLFLVEDEVYALKALEQKIKDIGGPYEIVGTASNGRQALEQISQLNPAIILADIRMPDMDGIEMLGHLKEQGFQGISIIITGYQQFEYAKQALQLGVTDYLLKPINPTELEACLARCKEILTSRLRTQNAISFLIGNTPVSLDGISFERPLAINYLIAGNALEHFDSIIHPNVPYIPSADIEEIFKKHLPNSNIVCLDGVLSNEKVLLLTGQETPLQDLTPLLSAATQELENMEGTFITQYLCLCEKEENLAKDIRFGRTNAARSVVLGKSQVLFSPPAHKNKLENSKEYSELFSLLVRQQQYKLLQTNIKRLFNTWLAEEYPIFLIENYLVYFLDELNATLNSASDSFDSQFYIENIICFSKDNKDLAENFYLLLIELFVKNQMAEKNASGEELVARIEEYFSQNISTNITLQMLTDKMEVSKVYLCRVFKKHKNMTPIDYFTQLKIARAKQMIQTMPDVPFREIADALGFSDTYYFSKVFKKVTGYPPSELKNNL